MSLKRQKLDLDELWFDDLWSAIAAYSPEHELLVLGGRGSRRSLVALSWDEVPWDTFVHEPAWQPPAIREAAWTTGYLAVVPYEGADHEWPARAFRLKRTLVIDHEQRRAALCMDPDWAHCQHQLPFPPPGPGLEAPSAAQPRWVSSWTDAAYLEAVRGALEEIRQGRYYQINLLRYWNSDDAISRAQWLAQLRKMGGPFSAYIEMPGLRLVSFSPERFVRLDGDDQACWIETEPIKGTRPVSADPQEDARQRRDLMASEKDAAELNMIVDLLRNDLHRVCRPRSVEVLDPGSLHSFANVHHRIARIRGALRPDINLDLLFHALCPGGSITGAPKREVMAAIREKEARSRGVFMGNIIYKDVWSGRLDSSILIRTAVYRQRWEFAAGSGLVIHSDPAEELAEIGSKARVLPGIFVS